MGNFSYIRSGLDKRYAIAVFIALICGITCGIVIYNLSNINIYIKNYASDYVYYVFEFKNGTLILTRFLYALFFAYLFFALAYFCRVKYLTLAPVFIRSVIFAVYSAVLISINSLGGAIVAFAVYIPAYIISVVICCLCAEASRFRIKRIFLLPLLGAVADVVCMLLLVNVLFRAIIVIA